MENAGNWNWFTNLKFDDCIILKNWKGEISFRIQGEVVNNLLEEILSMPSSTNNNEDSFASTFRFIGFPFIC
jgi:hypothetical protein